MSNQQNGPGSRTFYSKSGSLTFWAGKPTRIFEEGVSKVLDPPQIQFSRLADGFGVFTTDDPVLIEALEKRAREAGDVFDGGEYQKRTTPADVRIEQQEREIEEQNRLITSLRAQVAQREQQQRASK